MLLTHVVVPLPCPCTALALALALTRILRRLPPRLRPSRWRQCARTRRRCPAPGMMLTARSGYALAACEDCRVRCGALPRWPGGEEQRDAACGGKGLGRSDVAVQQPACPNRVFVACPVRQQQQHAARGCCSFAPATRRESARSRASAHWSASVGSSDFVSAPSTALTYVCGLLLCRCPRVPLALTTCRRLDAAVR